MTSPMDCSHSLSASLHSFAADRFRDLHFSLMLTNGDQNARLRCKAESSKGFDALWHGTSYFLSLGSPNAANGFIFPFSPLTAECGGVGQTPRITHHGKVETNFPTCSFNNLFFFFLISTFYIFIWNLWFCLLENWKRSVYWNRTPTVCSICGWGERCSGSWCL